jgi:quinohemoprotein amine dehydrogenase beta subunit
MRTTKKGAVAFALVALAALAATVPAAAGDLLLTGAKPDRLYVIDAEKRTVRSEFRIPGANGIVGTIVPSPDGRVAYVLVNKMESISGIDLKTGREVFRADLSKPGERVKDFFAFDVTRDGRELVVYELPTLLKPNEYQVEEPRFAVFRTSAGLHAKPVRAFPAPRRLHMILMRPSGKTFYAVGFDLYEYEVATGKLVSTRGIQKWELPAHSQPDLLAFWPVTEPTGVFTSPVISDATADGKTTTRSGMMVLDVGAGTLEFNDFEDTSALIFSTVLSPDHKYAYGVYSTLTKVDMAKHSLANRVPVDHTFYAINIATDGHELYIGGAMCDVGFYDPATLTKRANLKLPGCGDQSLSSLRVLPAR